MLVFVFPSFGNKAKSSGGEYRIIHVYPHDPSAFTQGLIYVNGTLYESTGLYGQSTIRAIRLKTGAILKQLKLPEQYFGEGLTDWGDDLIQLTWQAHTGFIYDRATFHVLRTFHYAGEGWGLTHDDKNLILSDGTPALRFLDPSTFQEMRQLNVVDGREPVNNLNELEYIRGQIFANIWHSDRIARISPRTGKVLAWLDLSGLLPANERPNSEAVLNGIAYDAQDNHLFVTGKLWPKLFEIKLTSQAGQ